MKGGGGDREQLETKSASRGKIALVFHQTLYLLLWANDEPLCASPSITVKWAQQWHLLPGVCECVCVDIGHYLIKLQGHLSRYFFFF